MKNFLKINTIILLCFSPGVKAAANSKLMVATASNFTMALQKLAPEFEKQTGHAIEIISGSSQKLFTQITNGAPFDVFLSAEDQLPKQLQSHALADTQFTYASGRIALWSLRMKIPANGPMPKNVSKFAIANPSLAPYGRAAQQALEKSGLWESYRPSLIMGENIAQTYTYVATGNADAGIVAFSQVIGTDKGTYWLIPESFHEPIRQDGIILTNGRNIPLARVFMSFLKSSRSALQKWGYQ